MEKILNSTGHKLMYDDFVKAENCTLTDTAGNQYLDLESGVWCTSIGHCHPRISERIAMQSRRMMHSGYCYLNPLMNEAAAGILRITGIDSGKCVFLCSGSEAVEYSVKLVKNCSDKPNFLTLKNCYLSAYGISGERSEKDWIELDWKENQDIDSIDFKRIAAFVFEPGSASGLVQFPPKEWIGEIVQRVRENGGVVIANEITTGMGRTGKWFGYNHYDFVPDIVAIGKGLGNGYPVSCAAVSNTLLDRFDISGFHYSQSHQNDPLGAAIADEVIKVIEDDGLLQRACLMGNQIRSRLEEIKSRWGIIKEIRGRGLMLAIEFEENAEYSYADAINSELLKRNIILVKRPGFEVFRLDPALTVGEDSLEYFIKSMEEIISGL